VPFDVNLWAWLVLACVGTWCVSRLVAWRGLLAGLADTPGDRSSHRETTPRGGGLGISIAGVVTGAAFGLPVVVLLAMIGVAVLGLVDDRWHVEPRLRLLAQCLLAGASTGWLLTQSGQPLMTMAAIAIAFVLVLVGTTNVYNFMDGSNGMAGLMGVVVFGTIGLIAIGLAKDMEIGRVGLVIAAACCGFLPLNLRRRARVFMGDVGSTFLGFTAVLLALQLWTTVPTWGLCAMGAMTVFYVDAGWTLLTRIHRRERLFEAHRTHAYQRLVNELGWSHPVVALIYAGTQAAISVLLLVLSRRGFGAVFGGLTGLVIVLSCLYWYVQSQATRRA
jgi:Fuc2NAc and GlcNAc transferase